MNVQKVAEEQGADPELDVVDEPGVVAGQSSRHPG